MIRIPLRRLSGKQVVLGSDQQARGEQMSASHPGDTDVRLEARKSFEKSSAVPSLVGLVAGPEDWSQQEAVIVVIPARFWGTIGKARCLPCDVGLMLEV